MAVVRCWWKNCEDSLQTAFQKLSYNAHATFPQRCYCWTMGWNVPNMFWERFAAAMECLWCHPASHCHFYGSSGNVLKSSFTPPFLHMPGSSSIYEVCSMPKVLWSIFYVVVLLSYVPHTYFYVYFLFLHLFFYQCFLVPLIIICVKCYKCCLQRRGYLYFFDGKNFYIVAGFTLNCWNAWCFSCP